MGVGLGSQEVEVKMGMEVGKERWTQGWEREQGSGVGAASKDSQRLPGAGVQRAAGSSGVFE